MKFFIRLYLPWHGISQEHSEPSHLLWHSALCSQDHAQHEYAQHTCSNQLLRGSILAECMWGSRCLYDNICSSLSLYKIKAIASETWKCKPWRSNIKRLYPTEAFYLRYNSIFPKRWCLFSLIIKKSIAIITIIIVCIISIINIIIINIIIIIILVIIIVINISLDFNCVYTCSERPAVSSKIPFSVFIYLSLRLSLLGAHWSKFYPQARKVDLQVRFMETMFRYETHYKYVYPFIA